MNANVNKHGSKNYGRNERKKGSSKKNIYYLNIAKRYRAVKFIILTVFIAYLLSMIAIFRNEITVENFRYLIKYLDTNSPEYTGETRRITYDPAADIQLGLFKGELAVVRGKSVDIYNMLGNLTLSYVINYAKPVLKVSKQYMLIYSQNESSYTINNIFSELYGESLDFPISGAAVSDSGSYAIITKTLEYRSAVYIYDKNFNRLAHVLKGDKLVMDVDISSDGNRTLVLSVYTLNGEFYTELLMMRSPYSETSQHTNIVPSSCGVKCGFNAAGGYTVICDDKILFYSGGDELISTYSYNNLVPLNFFLGDYYSVLAFNENIIGSNNNVYVFGSGGELLYKGVISGQITDIDGDSETIYFLLENGAVELKPLNGTVRQGRVANGGLRLMLMDKNRMLISYPQYADVYMTEEVFGENSDNYGETNK